MFRPEDRYLVDGGSGGASGGSGEPVAASVLAQLSPRMSLPGRPVRAVAPSGRPPDYVVLERRRRGTVVERLRRQGRLVVLYPSGRHGSGGRGGILGLLDRPYEWVTSRGGELISWFTERSMREKAEGDHLEGFLYALGASASAFLVGAATGITGLISPRAWRETVYAVTHPRETLGALRNPLSWSYLAGSIVGPAKLFKAVGARMARVVEPDVSVTWRGSLRLVGRVAEGEHRWAARLEAEGPARPVGRASAAARPPPERVVEVETPRGRIEVVEARRGPIVRRAFRAEVRGKRVLGFEEWEVGRGRYRYRGVIADPEQLLALETRERPATLNVSRLLGPPRVVVEPRLWPLGAVAGVALGLGSLGGIGGLESRVSAEPLEGLGGLGSLVEPGTTGKASAARRSQASRAVTAAVAALGSGASSESRGAYRFRLPGGVTPVDPAPRKRGRRRYYGEIVYPRALLPI